MDVRVFGKNRNVVKIKLADEMGYPMDGIYFGDGDLFLEEIRDKKTIAIVYYPEVNVYQGRENLQVVIRYYRGEE